MFKIYGGDTEFKQWELDKLVTNSCMRAGDEVVFRNSHGETYVVRAFAKDGSVYADVPNYLLRTAGNILVDLGQGNERHTECRTTFTVTAAAKPEDYKCDCNTPERYSSNGGDVDIDGLTIVRDANGKLSTAIGGYKEYTDDTTIFDTALFGGAIDISTEEEESEDGTVYHVGGYDWAPYIASENIEEGEEYSIIINGVKVYRGVARDGSDVDLGITVGNLFDVLQTGNIVPCIGFSQNDLSADLAIVSAEPYSGTLDIQIIKHPIAVHPISERFMPMLTGTTDELTPAQVRKAVLAGRPVAVSKQSNIFTNFFVDDQDGCIQSQVKCVLDSFSCDVSILVGDWRDSNSWRWCYGSIPIPSLDLNLIGKKLILPSTTSGSRKKFAITVDDSGVLTATEYNQGGGINANNERN